MNYRVLFNDGSISPLEIKSVYGRRRVVGLATRGDGYRRVVFFNALTGHVTKDPWIRSVTDANNVVAVYPGPEFDRLLSSQ